MVEQEVEDILIKIKAEAKKLASVDNVPIAEFSVTHRDCRTVEEEAGMIGSMGDNFVMENLAWAAQTICVDHGVTSMKYAIKKPMHKKIGD